MPKIDLQIHSYYSDGENSPEEILDLVEKKNIKLFSITDHNFIHFSIRELQNRANKKNTVFLQGVEISAIDKVSKESFHILGYSKNFNIEQLNKDLSGIIDGYNKRARFIINKLNDKYKCNFDFDRLLNESKSSCLSRNFLADKLVQFFGNKLNIKEAINETYVEEDDYWMIDPKEVIEIIKKNNGIAVWAHPGNFVIKGNFEMYLNKFINYGLVGIEVYYSKHSQETVKILEDFVNKYNLIATAGSDWHGEKFSSSEMGMKVEEKILKELIKEFI